MIIVVPEQKRIANLTKHGIDLADFRAEFSWDCYTVLPAHPSVTGREREMLIGTMQGRVVAAVVSPLGREAIAVISIRTADTKERAAHDAQG